MTRLEGKVAVVTGAGRGLGRAHALDLAAHGADVVVNDVNLSPSGDPAGETSPLDEVVRAVRALGRRAVANRDSVATPGGAAGILRTALDAFGRVDIVVNNAGFLRDRTIGKMSDEEWTTVLDVHLAGGFYVARAFWRELRTNAGALVFTTSHAGLLGQFGQSNYAAAKAGIVGLARTLAHEGRRDGVRVNVIAPIATTRLSALANDQLRDAVADFDPAYVARMVTCLAGAAETGAVFGIANGAYSRFVLHETEPVRFDGVPTADDLDAALPTLAGERASAPAVMPS
ncbi:SDR family NAD(P)-dependent oxidoreductase [Phytohabitans kaempferiae]|uniref:SDR family NAD(P)-dependent oxidoreductase n=1 Tax=Phytohabitans kaempferiae TaxID=1620943 RepID=A0ABV6M514_9ACTN